MGKSLLLVCLAVLLAGCVKPSDMQATSRYYLGDAGVLDHHRIERRANWTLQSDSRLFIAQGHYMPDGNARVRPNIVAEQAFAAAVELFPEVRRASQPLGLDEALGEARRQRMDYLLYARFASARDALGSVEQWEQQGTDAPLGTDRAVLQLTLFEAGSRRQIDHAVIRSRGGFLQLWKADPEDLLGRPLRDYLNRLLAR